jgi:hypothetical protein
MNRRVRPDLKRAKPIRNVIHHLWSPVLAGAGDDKMADRAASPKSVNKIISDAVGLGYKVIEEQISQGQQAAERFRSGAYSASHAEEDVKKLMDRTMNLVKELGVVGFDLAAAVLRDPRASAVKGFQSDISVRIQSKKRVEVNYHLSSPTAHFEPSIPPLYAADRALLPLKNIRMEKKDHRAVLVVEVPDAHPAGTYTGVIEDAKSRQPGGFISVAVLD